MLHARRLYDQLADYHHTMSSDACEDLDLPEGSTYAHGVRSHRDLGHRLFEEQYDLAHSLLDDDELAALCMTVIYKLRYLRAD